MRFGLILRRLLDRPQLVPVVIALECRRNRETHILDQRMHIVPEFHAFACREGQGPRSLRIVEIVDVAPIAAGRFACGAIAHELLDEAMTMASRPAQDEYVVTGTVNLYTEANGLDCALLSQARLTGRQLIAAIESCLEGLTCPAQIFGSNGVCANGLHGHLTVPVAYSPIFNCPDVFTDINSQQYP